MLNNGINVETADYVLANHSEKLDLPFWSLPQDGNKGTFISSDHKEDLIKIIRSEKTLKTDLIYLKMSEMWATNSHCKRTQVGCLVVKNKSIISDGYNGSPSGFPNQCEDENNVTLPYVLHAETNAITKLAKSTNSSDGATIYVTLSPCFECSKLIIQAGIKRVVFKELYRKTDSIKFLHEAGIEIVRIKEIE
jgi:dCMP deaminase